MKSYLIAVFIFSSVAVAVSIQANRCDVERAVTTKTKCTNCRANMKVNCPFGYFKSTRGRGRKGCRYRIGGSAITNSRPVLGCYHKCTARRREAQCCEEYWGQDCQECPKYSGITCSGRGTCFDGITANGTCKCLGNVAGAACERCLSNDQYGPYCEQVCGCVHGKCDSGVGRSGRCSCESGYGGAHCNIVLADCESMNCHQHSRCINQTGPLECRCNSGYAGNGTFCSEIDPCEESSANLCHDNATCSHTGPGTYACICRPNYSGDGKWCSPIDPCQTNNGGCPRNTTQCQYTGPGQASCVCKPGYQNSSSASCSLIDVCGRFSNTSCHSIANCTTVEVNNVITVRCQCPLGTSTRGLRCVTDLLSELTVANKSGVFQNKLNKAISLFSSNYFHELSFHSSYTILAPIDDAFPADFGQPDNSPLWKARARSQIVLGEIDIEFSEGSAVSMYPFLGGNFTIKALRPSLQSSNSSDNSSSYTAQLMLNDIEMGKILGPAGPASNGLFYVTDCILGSAWIDQYYGRSNWSLDQALNAIPSASQFYSLWKTSKVARELNSKSSFSIFLPDNDAFSVLSEDDLKFLRSPAALFKLNLLLRNHIIASSITAVELFFYNIQANLTESGLVFVGESQAKILLTEVPLSGGNYIYLIDKVMIPDDITPLVENICDDVTQTMVWGSCGDCHRTSNICPKAAVQADDASTQRCIYEATTGDGATGQRLGCIFKCVANTTRKVCCPGFYGEDCTSCPGPTHDQCNSNGVCGDGKTGNGQCRCNEGFAGEDCSLCANGNKFGSECDQNCTCENGICDNSVTSRGLCISGSCEDQWAGRNCDRTIRPCGSRGLKCHQYALCLIGGNDSATESCVCEPGYTGEGTDCLEFNPCTDLSTRGGCSLHAHCLFHGLGNNTCVCEEFYQGDGHKCEAINLCHERESPCNENANCLFTGPGQMTCACRSGYRGNGLVCTEIDNCVESNGGCHYRARCRFTGPGTNDCTCMDGYQGDGIHCVGTLVMEIAEHPQLSLIKNWVDRVRSVKALFLSVQYSQVTAFLPRDSAWVGLALDDYHFWTSPQNLPYIIKQHIVKAIVASDDLTPETSLQSLLPTEPIIVSNVTDEINIQDTRNNLSIAHRIPTLGKERSKILLPDLQTFNGLVHIISDVLLPPRDVVGNYPLLKDAAANSTNTSLEEFSIFLSYLNSTGIIDRLDTKQDPYTIFALPNELLRFADAGNYSFQFLAYHIVPGKLLRLESVTGGQHEITMAGEGYQISLMRQHASVSVNGQNLEKGGLRTSRGIIHALSNHLLQPTKQRCDEITRKIRVTGCQPCNPLTTCPGGATLLFKARCRSSIRFSWHTAFFCRLTCLDKTTIPHCCKGFFGAECEPCPGGIGNVCFNHGTCFDGMKGNGTCSCNDTSFVGTACSECAANLYGSDCQLSCDCVNGQCDDGRKGSGVCLCKEGYAGKRCERTKDNADACGGQCNNSASCVAGSCVCDAGFTGDGRSCTPQNPCKETIALCHRFASCKYAGPGRHTCRCKTGYNGDGSYCYEINPCLTPGFDGCHANAECRHVGANRYNCLCGEGYTGDGKTCQEIDPCQSQNGGCHIYATCSKTGPGTRACKCLGNYVGDGILNCTGTMYVELASDRTLSWILNEELVQRTLNSPYPITIFLPVISQSDESGMYGNLTLFLLNHVTACGMLTMSELRSMSQLKTVIGGDVFISVSQDSVLLNGNISVNGGRIFSNGIMYVINDTLPVARGMMAISIGPPLAMLEKKLQKMKANRFVELLKATESWDVLSRVVHKSWTLLVPDDNAFNQLSSYKQRQLTTDVSSATEYVRYHMIRESQILPFEVAHAEEMTSWQGSAVTFRCSSTSKGALTINQADVTNFDPQLLLPATNVISLAIYFINKVLQPPSIGGRCDVVTNSTFDGICTFCTVGPKGCPTGMTYVGSKQKKCHFSVGQFSRIFDGCSPVCSFYNVTRQCCAGYYGNDCHPCPGLPEKACRGNGHCQEGLKGTGSCVCDPGFKGIACELCEAGRFGSDCQRCNCSVHGRCADGIESDGFCFCDRGWTGKSCKQKIAHPSTCQPNCVENAVCLESGECQCEYGYVGSGSFSCNLQDFCADNPCSIHATCISRNFSAVCMCNPPYAGDGFVCTGYDPCHDKKNPPKCHPLAQCIYVGPNITRCQCPPGYHGDGKIFCTPNADTTSSCALNHGSCSNNAFCNDVTARDGRRLVNCTCKPGYTGDGHVCNGNLYQVFTAGLYNIGKFYKKAMRWDVVFLIKLRQARNMTLFVPRDQAVTNKRINRRMLLRHVLSGQTLTADELRKKSWVLVDARMAVSVRNINGTVYINGVKVVLADIPATNGVIHIIEDVIPSHVYQEKTTPGSTTSALSVLSRPTRPSTKKIATQRTTVASSTTASPSASEESKIRATSASSGVKVGIAVAIIFALLLVVVLIYWRRRSGSFTFSPLTERRHSSPGAVHFSGGMINPAYDSTAFKEPLLETDSG